VKIVKIFFIMMLFNITLNINVQAADTVCHGAEGDRASPAGVRSGASLPAKRSCLNPDVARLIGTKRMDIPSGMVVDKNGNAYISGETKGFDDTSAGDLFLLKLSPSGETEWMVTYGGKKDEGIRAHDANTEGDGQSSMIDIDDQGNIYVIGRGKSYQGTYAGIALKFNAEGKLLWDKHYRPFWKGTANSEVEFNAVAVHNGIVHIVGIYAGAQALIYALDAKTGGTVARLAMDPSPKFRDILYSLVVDPSGKSVYVGGWSGSGPRGLLMKIDFTGTAYKVNWARKIPLPWGSNFPAMVVDNASGLYVVADIHGASTYSELHKYDTHKGKLKWVRHYNKGVNNGKTQTHVIKLLGDKLIVGGKIGFTGTYTYAHNKGDAFFIILDRKGNLEKEYYFFTGTRPFSLDAIKDIEVHGNDLYIMGWHWGEASIGEWRIPADYKAIKHPWTKGDRRDYRAKKIKVISNDLSTTSKIKDGSSLKEYTFDDEAGDYIYNEIPKKGLKRPSSTSVYFFIFKQYMDSVK